MKTYRHLYPQVWDFENLYLAYRKARRGKRGKVPAAAFERHEEEELLRLQSELRAKTYLPGPYHSFAIHEPKRRLISAAPFRDRVVHHALCRVIEPIWESSGRGYWQRLLAAVIGSGWSRPTAAGEWSQSPCSARGYWQLIRGRGDRPVAPTAGRLKFQSPCSARG